MLGFARDLASVHWRLLPYFTFTYHSRQLEKEGLEGHPKIVRPDEKRHDSLPEGELEVANGEEPRGQPHTTRERVVFNFDFVHNKSIARNRGVLAQSRDEQWVVGEDRTTLYPFTLETIEVPIKTLLFVEVVDTDSRTDGAESPRKSDEGRHATAVEECNECTAEFRRVAPCTKIVEKFLKGKDVYVAAIDDARHHNLRLVEVAPEI